MLMVKVGRCLTGMFFRSIDCLVFYVEYVVSSVL